MYSTYKRQRNLDTLLSPPGSTSASHLPATGTRQGVRTFIAKFERTGTIARTPGSGRPTKVTAEVRDIVEQQMRRHDETTASQLHALLVGRGYILETRPCF